MRSRYDIVWLPLKRYCVPLSVTSNAWKNMFFELQNSSPIWFSFLYTLAVLLFLNSNGVLFSFANLFFAFLEGICFNSQNFANFCMMSEGPDQKEPTLEWLKVI